MQVRPDWWNETQFFQAEVVSILLYGCTTWMLIKHMEKKLDGNYTKMLWAILNMSWRQHPTKQQPYNHLSPIMKTILVRWTRRVGHCWRSRDELTSDILLWISHMHEQRQDVQLEPTYNSSVLIQIVALKTYRKWWTIERGSGRGSRRSILMAKHDDDYHSVIDFSYLFCNIAKMSAFFDQ